MYKPGYEPVRVNDAYLRRFAPWARRKAHVVEWLYYRLTVRCCTCDGRLSRGYFTLTGFNICPACRERRRK